MKFHIGQPVQVPSERYGAWKAYVAWYYPDRNEYLLSVKGYSTLSHMSRRHEDEIEERTLGKHEMSVHKKFQEYAEMLWADRKKFERKHSCRGCPMMPEYPKPYESARELAFKCCCRSIRASSIDVFPFTKTRCLLRPDSEEEAEGLRRKIQDNRERKGWWERGKKKW